MKTRMFRAVSSTCFVHTRIATVVAAGLMAGCSTIGGGVDELLGEEPLNNIEFSDEDAIDYDGGAFSRRFYGTIGGGASRLEPDTSEVPGVDVNDRVAGAGQIAVGADLSNTFSVELHSADLGSAGLSPTGRINYHVNGGSVLLYAGNDRGERKGFMGYGRLGVAVTDNSAVGNVAFVSNDDPQPLIGAGVEYMGRKVGLRSEVIVFDKDAQFAQLGVIYRLGGGNGGADELPDTITPVPLPEPQLTRQPIEELPDLPDLPETTTQPLADLEPIPDVRDEQADTDADGIPNPLDNCPTTEAGMEVDDKGCAIFNGVVDGVNFARGSAQLTADAQLRLDSVISTLQDFPDALIAIAAHTDGTGREEDNLALSRERAISVARYLISRGVPKSLMSARAFGEYQPIADNTTAEGRAINRRVEIVASKSQPAN